MKRIVIINPNATQSMTDDMVSVAKSVASNNMTVTGVTNTGGPAAIQGQADADASLPGLFKSAEGAAADGADVIIIGCFDDTGLYELRAKLPCAVIGLGEAGAITASILAPKFAVMTTTQKSVPVIEANIATMGLATRCAGVFASGIPVLSLETNVDALRFTLADIEKRTDAGAVILGCAGMTTLTDLLAGYSRLRLVDPVRAAIGLGETAAIAAV